MTAFAVVALYCAFFVGISFFHTYPCTVVTSAKAAFIASDWVAFEWVHLVFSQDS